MRKLILVRHSVPEQQPDVPAKKWQLSEEGRRRCQGLAERLVALEPSHFIASTEPKAIETAKLLAAPFARPVEIVPGLHEHDRGGTGYLGEQAFQAAIKAFFEQPDKLVFGRETGEAAYQRFRLAVEAVLAQSLDGNPVIVAHGTVISLFVARCAKIEALAFWQKLKMPMAIVLSLPDLNLLEIIQASC
jgi:broad specificity phosphatase PhoE